MPQRKPITRQQAQDAANGIYGLEYQPASDPDLIDPRSFAKRIAKALRLNIPGKWKRDIESGIHIMMLCAGNQLSLSIPFHVQYLYAHQRVSDHAEGRVVSTPEEVERILTILRASMIVREFVKAAEKAAKQLPRRNTSH